jgi:hypothetical protein
MRGFVLFVALSVTGVQAGDSRIAALSLIESGDNDEAVGGAGEVSRYQIKPWIWRQYNQSSSYADRRISTGVAEKHLTDLADRFRRAAHREPSDFDLYVLWNAGPTYYARISFAPSRVHPIIRERARRYVNLCQRERVAMASTASARVVVQPREKPVEPAFVGNRSSTNSAGLWPVFDASPAAGLQDPMFAVFPLTARPIVSSPGQQPIFAVGGIKSQ